MSERQPNTGVTSGWSCPECSRTFAKTGQRHVCGTWTVEGHLLGKPDHVVDLFHRFTEHVAACGPFEHAPVQHQIGFRVRRIFAGVRLLQTGLRGYVDLTRRVESDRFRSIDPYTKRLFVHSFTLTSPEQLDEEFDGWLRESYAVGEGKHLEQQLPDRPGGEARSGS